MGVPVIPFEYNDIIVFDKVAPYEPDASYGAFPHEMVSEQLFIMNKPDLLTRFYQWSGETISYGVSLTAPRLILFCTTSPCIYAKSLTCSSVLSKVVCSPRKHN